MTLLKQKIKKQRKICQCNKRSNIYIICNRLYGRCAISSRIYMIREIIILIFPFFMPCQIVIGIYKSKDTCFAEYWVSRESIERIKQYASNLRSAWLRWSERMVHSRAHTAGDNKLRRCEPSHTHQKTCTQAGFVF